MTVEMQVEGGIAFGLTAALYGEISIADGRVAQSNFHDYDMLRLAGMPKVETIWCRRADSGAVSASRPSAIVAPAVCNAIFAATGQRIRSLPLQEPRSAQDLSPLGTGSIDRAHECDARGLFRAGQNKL